METVGFPDRSQTCFNGQEDRGAVLLSLAGRGTPGERGKASWYPHASPRSIIYPPLPDGNKCYVLSAERSSHWWESRNSFSELWWRNLVVHTVNATLNPVPTDSLEAFTLACDCLFLHTSVRQQITTHKKVIVWDKMSFISFSLKIWNSYLAWATWGAVGNYYRKNR